MWSEVHAFSYSGSSLECGADTLSASNGIQLLLEVKLLTKKSRERKKNDPIDICFTVDRKMQTNDGGMCGKYSPSAVPRSHDALVLIVLPYHWINNWSVNWKMKNRMIE